MKQFFDNAREQLLFCSFKTLFADIFVAIAVVVCLSLFKNVYWQTELEVFCLKFDYQQLPGKETRAPPSLLERSAVIELSFKSGLIPLDLVWV